MGSNGRPGWQARMRAALRRRFGIDTRALAAFRIAIAVLVVVDLLAYRAPDLGAFYTNAGVLPASLLETAFPVAAALSLHPLAGSLAGQIALLAAFVAAASALLVGYRTRLAGVVTWVLLASMHARNPHVLNAGDTLVLATLFFGLFLPLGERWSVDAVRRAKPRRDSPPASRRVANAATLGLLLQVVAVYATNAVFKTRSQRWMEGTAVAHVFALDDFTVLLGDLLAQVPGLPLLANWVWVATVAASPLLLVLTGWARVAFLGLLAGLHLGMHVTLMLGLFPLVSIAALLVFLPAPVWDRLEDRLGGLGDDLARRVPLDPSPTRGSWRIPDEAREKLARSINVALAAVILAGGLWHAMALGYVDKPAVAEEAGRAGEHEWRMFSPPSTTYGWVAAPANLTSGERVDALQLAPYDPRPPAELADAYPSTLWHRYLKDLPELTEAEQDALADYLCRRTADAYGEPATEVQLVYVEHHVRLDGPDPVERHREHVRACPPA